MNAWYRPASSTFGFLYVDMARAVSTAARQDWSFPPLRAPHPAARFKRSLIIGRKFNIDAIGATNFFGDESVSLLDLIGRTVEPGSDAISEHLLGDFQQFTVSNCVIGFICLIIYRNRLWIQMLHYDSYSSVKYWRRDITMLLNKIRLLKILPFIHSRFRYKQYISCLLWKIHNKICSTTRRQCFRDIPSLYVKRSCRSPVENPLLLN